MSLSDQADWDGIQMESAAVGARTRRRRWRIDGVQYVSEGEALLARLLIFMDIPFTPDVPILLRREDGRAPSILYVPDFILDRAAYIWSWPNGRREVIHGLEVKGSTRPLPGVGRPVKKSYRRTLGKIIRLRQERNINVLLLTDREVRRYFRHGRLPLRPLPEAR